MNNIEQRYLQLDNFFLDSSEENNQLPKIKSFISVSGEGIFGQELNCEYMERKKQMHSIQQTVANQQDGISEFIILDEEPEEREQKKKKNALPEANVCKYVLNKLKTFIQGCIGKQGNKKKKQKRKQAQNLFHQLGNREQYGVLLKNIKEKLNSSTSMNIKYFKNKKESLKSLWPIFRPFLILKIEESESIKNKEGYLKVVEKISQIVEE